VIVAGVIVTGSGPHAGDQNAKRNGLDPAAVAQTHADLVFLLIGLSVALWFALRAVPAPPAAVRAAGVLVLVELAQGLIGFVQYFTHLPVILVAAHMLGATLVWTATLSVLWSLRERPAPTSPAPAAPTERATAIPTPAEPATALPVQ
jgi:heme a synthase